MWRNNPIVSYLIDESFDKNDRKMAECPFCGHVMHRHKIVTELGRKIVSLCQQCKAPCFEITSLQKVTNDQIIMSSRNQNRDGAPFHRQKLN